MDDWLIIIIAICGAALLALVVQLVVRAHQRKVSVGREEMVGVTAEVETVLDPKGIVLIEGERWAAISEKGRVKIGEEVIVTRVDGLKLWVVKKEIEEVTK
ncbi:MAG TPA: NfeD family protein [Dehalococcoidales bacterium]|nr:NfeD family protein [Dehalococcoidales bacterium]